MLYGEEHVRKYRATDGKEGHDWNGTQALILTTTGRKSGESRDNALIYGMSGDNPVIVASKGGAPVHPDWYFNLTTSPRSTCRSGEIAFPLKHAPPPARSGPNCGPR